MSRDPVFRDISYDAFQLQLRNKGYDAFSDRADNVTLDGLRQYAAKNGTRTVSDEKRLSIPRNYNIAVHDSCEVYVLPKYGGYSPIYYICPESGYFVLYW